MILSGSEYSIILENMLKNQNIENAYHDIALLNIGLYFGNINTIYDIIQINGKSILKPTIQDSIQIIEEKYNEHISQNDKYVELMHKNNKKIKELNSEIGRIENELSNFKDHFESLENEYSTANSNLNTQKEKIQVLQQSKGKKRGKINDDLTAETKKLEKLQLEFEQKNANLENAEEHVSTLNDNLNTLVKEKNIEIMKKNDLTIEYNEISKQEEKWKLIKKNLESLIKQIRDSKDIITYIDDNMYFKFNENWFEKQLFNEFSFS